MAVGGRGRLRLGLLGVGALRAGLCIPTALHSVRGRARIISKYSGFTSIARCRSNDMNIMFLHKQKLWDASDSVKSKPVFQCIYIHTCALYNVHIADIMDLNLLYILMHTFLYRTLLL